jgi:choice-of-anchor A domain-containing protein
MASGRSQAQEPMSLAAIAASAGTVVGYLEKGYSAYKFLDGIFNPQPTTAELIQAAVVDMKNFITDTVLISDWYPKANDVGSLLSIAQQTNADADWQLFETEANKYLFDVENAIRTAPQGYGTRYAHALAGIYNIYMPVLMAVHLNGNQHKLPLLFNVTGTTYATQVLSLAKRLIQLDYELVGTKSSIRGSALWLYIKDHFNHKCLESDDVCDAYFKTDPVVQAIQIGGAGVYRTFGADPNFPNLNIVMGTDKNTLTIDPIASWGNNWQGYENAVWVPIYTQQDGNYVPNRSCPVDYGIVGVWNIGYRSNKGTWWNEKDYLTQEGWHQGFLCQKMPQLPPWNAFSTTVQSAQSGIWTGGGGITFQYSCSPDFVAGFSDELGFLCRSRKDGSGPIMPTKICLQKSDCSSLDSNMSMPPGGAFTALPATTYLNFGNFTAFKQNNYSYGYAKAQVPWGVGALKDMWRAGGIELAAGYIQHYPDDFNIFVLKDAIGLQDVRGPVAAGGKVSANYFSINVDGNRPVGLVAGGALDLPTGGTVNGISYAGGATNISPNVSMTTPKNKNPINFQAAFSKLQDMSTMLSRLPATGNAKLEYSTLTLSSADPNFTVFSVSADTLSKTSTIKYAFPATTTVVINVVGTAVTMQNMGFQTPSSGYDTTKLKPNRVIWNFPEAKTLFGSSVSIPGSVLAPSADVEIRWGALDGTLVASSVKGFYEYHWAPFRKNLLVP